MGKVKVVIDTNIYISALGYIGPEREIIKKAIRGQFSLYASKSILEEVYKVLDYPKFAFSITQKNSAKLILTEIVKIIDTPLKLELIKNDPSDNKFLECALAADANYIVSGDRHLLKIGSLGKTIILKSRDFLKLKF